MSSKEFVTFASDPIISDSSFPGFHRPELPSVPRPDYGFLDHELEQIPFDIEQPPPFIPNSFDFVEENAKIDKSMRKDTSAYEFPVIPSNEDGLISIRNTHHNDYVINISWKAETDQTGDDILIDIRPVKG